MRYICKILVKLSQFFQNPEIRKVTLDYKLHLELKITGVMKSARFEAAEGLGR